MWWNFKVSLCFYVFLLFFILPEAGRFSWLKCNLNLWELRFLNLMWKYVRGKFRRNGWSQFRFVFSRANMRSCKIQQNLELHYCLCYETFTHSGAWELKGKICGGLYKLSTLTFLVRRGTLPSHPNLPAFVYPTGSKQ